MKKQATDCEKTSVYHLSDKGLVSRIEKGLSKVSAKKTKSN